MRLVPMALVFLVSLAGAEDNGLAKLRIDELGAAMEMEVSQQAPKGRCNRCTCPTGDSGGRQRVSGVPPLPVLRILGACRRWLSGKYAIDLSGRWVQSAGGHSMCEFCHKHGEGRKWYLEASNYSEDMLSDVRRRRFLERFVRDPGSLFGKTHYLDRIAKLPRVLRSAIFRAATGAMKKVHYGQVVPLEEIRQIFGFVNSIVRVACVCRHYTQGGGEKRYCYGISMAPNGGELGGIFRGAAGDPRSGPYASGLEELTAEQAVEALEDHEKQGMCHTVWTFHTPFICGICNCDREGCLAVRSVTRQGLPAMFRAEHVAVTSRDACSSCMQCQKVCQFDAITFSSADRKATIDPLRCFGCGICRSVCSRNAIRLVGRSTVPAAAGLW